MGLTTVQRDCAACDSTLPMRVASLSRHFTCNRLGKSIISSSPVTGASTRCQALLLKVPYPYSVCLHHLCLITSTESVTQSKYNWHNHLSTGGKWLSAFGLSTDINQSGKPVDDDPVRAYRWQESTRKTAETLD